MQRSKRFLDLEKFLLWVLLLSSQTECCNVSGLHELSSSNLFPTW